ncbi:hypothetical protein B5G34_16720 [Flavonifractor sp. An82]|uniref:hypothetical protein n=1 Tax=Flavonifractor sp. An82 TaxID=1965660 RepID=UPI000B39BD7F|nr:hypothetical protein [Flavonifractor sp. An82]OUN19923.1 hypothetical protein B5G34_16720 [Flavonifractor sp. An82]
MLCQVAELLVEIPAADGMDRRCRDYRTESALPADIVIRREDYRPEAWPTLSEDYMAYMESGIQFYLGLLGFHGLMLHASAVEHEGRAYLFSGPCGAGKSTRTRLWRDQFGAVIFNDDKPALRRMEEGWCAYGTPWCGKDGINQNQKTPLGGICFLRRDDGHVQIRPMEPLEAIRSIMSQTLYQLWPRQMDQLLPLVEGLVTEIPIFEMSGPPNGETAALCRDTMTRAAKERFG